VSKRANAKALKGMGMDFRRLSQIDNPSAHAGLMQISPEQLGAGDLSFHPQMSTAGVGAKLSPVTSPSYASGTLTMAEREAQVHAMTPAQRETQRREQLRRNLKAALPPLLYEKHSKKWEKWNVLDKEKR
jgi:hypothetical protein